MDIERPIRSCEHNPQHQHGTRLAYKTCRCRCDDCIEAQREYDRNRKRRDRRGGKQNPIDAAQAHIHYLKSHGMSPKLIAERAGVYASTIQRIDRGDAHHVISGTEELILAVQPENTAPKVNLVPAIGPVRRLRHLALQGWSTKDIAAVSNLSYRTLQDIIRGDQDYITETNAREIQSATRVLLGRTPPPGRIRTYVASLATNKGWVSMFAYDDVDDPNEIPNVTTLGPKRTKDEAAEERIADLEYLLVCGEPVLLAATRAGYKNAKSAYEAVRHKGREDLMAYLRPHVTAEARDKETAA